MEKAADATKQFVSILANLSEKRSSIEAATNYALGRPEHAPELFAAIVDRLQVREALPAIGSSSPSLIPPPSPPSSTSLLPPLPSPDPHPCARSPFPSPPLSSSLSLASP